MGAAVLSAGAIVGVNGVAKGTGTARPDPTPLESVVAIRAEMQTEGLWQQAKEYGRQQQRTRAAAAAAAQAEADRVAAEQAAEQAAAEQAAAEAAAEAARPEEAARAARSRPEPTADVAVDVEPGSAQAIAAEMVAARGWGSDQFDCLVNLWERESGWQVDAENSSSGAYGIPQALPGSKMASAGADWRTNPATQIEWGLGYIEERYGDPCGAWSHFLDRNWY
jgi:hypothetical protein